MTTRLRHLAASFASVSSAGVAMSPSPSSPSPPPPLAALLHPAFPAKLHPSEPDSGAIRTIVEHAVFSFPLLNEDGCDWFVREFRGDLPERDDADDLPKPAGSRKPNALHHYGHVLTERESLPSFRGFVAELLETMGPLLRRLYPESNPAASWLYPDLEDLLSWRDDPAVVPAARYPHHVFVIRYLPREQSPLPAHIDSARVTLNLCLFDSSETTLVFEDPLDREPDKKKRRKVQVKHERGWAVCHLGDVWHEVLVPPGGHGERWNLVFWL
ncbi:hypothetical protein DFJ74DRAFT_688283, partial [Hyaloraphidium curvatum]